MNKDLRRKVRVRVRVRVMAFRREGNQGAWGALGRACLAGSRSPEYLEQRAKESCRR